MRSMVSNIKPKVDIKHNLPQIIKLPTIPKKNTPTIAWLTSDATSQLRFCSDPIKGGELSEPKVGSVDAMILKFQKCPLRINVATSHDKVTYYRLINLLLFSNLWLTRHMTCANVMNRSICLCQVWYFVGRLFWNMFGAVLFERCIVVNMAWFNDQIRSD